VQAHSCEYGSPASGDHMFRDQNCSQYHQSQFASSPSFISTPVARRWFCLLLVHVSLLLHLVFAADATAQQMPAQVLERVANAYGSRLASGQILDSVSEGQITFFNIGGLQARFDVTLLRKGSNQVQRVIQQPTTQVFEGSDGNRNWQSLGSRFTPTARGHALHFIESETIRSVSALLNYRSVGLSLRDKGKRDKVEVIEVQDTQGRITEYFIDDDTSVVRRLQFATGESTDPFSGKTIPEIEAYLFSDFRMVEGVLTPFTIARYIKGVKSEETQFTSVRYNTAIQDDSFKP
jgi:hypothetical protein